MSSYSGRGGHIYTLGDSFGFTAPLLDCGDGWDWQLVGLRCLETDSLTFQHWTGEWEDLQALEVYPRTGLVSFARCLRGEAIMASGIGRTASFLGEGETWRLEIDTVVSQKLVLGSEGVQTEVRPGDAKAVVTMAEGLVGPVLVELPFARTGVLVGTGNALPTTTGTHITFDPEGVVYEPRFT